MPTIVVHLIAAARPNFMKIAPLYHTLTNAPLFVPKIVHIGQHYDANMSDTFFADRQMPTSDLNLNARATY